jgi:hypothetical protein
VCNPVLYINMYLLCIYLTYLHKASCFTITFVLSIFLFTFYFILFYVSHGKDPDLNSFLGLLLAGKSVPLASPLNLCYVMLYFLVSIFASGRIVSSEWKIQPWVRNKTVLWNTELLQLKYCLHHLAFLRRALLIAKIFIIISILMFI